MSLLRAMRRRIILDDREHLRLLLHGALARSADTDPEMRSLLFRARSVRRWRHRELLRLNAFHNLCKAFEGVEQDRAIGELELFLSWLELARPAISRDVAAPQHAQALRDQDAALAEIPAALRELAKRLSPDFERRLSEFADEVVGNPSAMRDWIFGTTLLNPSLAGRSGRATDKDGGYRGWLIRECASRMPEASFATDLAPYTTIAGLLSWALIEGVTPQLVRSVLKAWQAK
jgi:hypothetical protein